MSFRVDILADANALNSRYINSFIWLCLSAYETHDLLAELDQRDQTRPRQSFSICSYQRSTSSVKPSISFSRLLATGLMAGSSAASDTQARSAAIVGSISRSLRPAADLRRDLPDVGLRLEGIAPVAEDRHPADQPPGQQFLDRVGDVGMRHARRSRRCPPPSSALRRDRAARGSG